jgi:hypothetical protein
VSNRSEWDDFVNDCRSYRQTQSDYERDCRESAAKIREIRDASRRSLYTRHSGIMVFASFLPHLLAFAACLACLMIGMPMDVLFEVVWYAFVVFGSGSSVVLLTVLIVRGGRNAARRAVARRGAERRRIRAELREAHQIAVKEKLWWPEADGSISIGGKAITVDGDDS